MTNYRLIDKAAIRHLIRVRKILPVTDLDDVNFCGELVNRMKSLVKIFMQMRELSLQYLCCLYCVRYDVFEERILIE